MWLSEERRNGEDWWVGVLEKRRVERQGIVGFWAVNRDELEFGELEVHGCGRTVSCHGCLVWVLRVGQAMRADGAAAVRSCLIMECVGESSGWYGIRIVYAGLVLVMIAGRLTG